MRETLFSGKTIIASLDLLHHRYPAARITPSILMQESKNYWGENHVYHTPGQSAR